MEKNEVEDCGDDGNEPSEDNDELVVVVKFTLPLVSSVIVCVAADAVVVVVVVAIVVVVVVVGTVFVVVVDIAVGVVVEDLIRLTILMRGAAIVVPTRDGFSEAGGFRDSFDLNAMIRSLSSVGKINSACFQRVSSLPMSSMHVTASVWGSCGMTTPSVICFPQLQSCFVFLP